MANSATEVDVLLAPNVSKSRVPLGQDNAQRSPQATSLVADPDNCTSAAPLIECRGNINGIWPNDCENRLPDLLENQTREITSELIEDTIEMY
jgi:hypothetical protein